MLDVSVPCAGCGAANRFGELRCDGCGARVGRDARDALHARLEASSDDYRDLMTQVNAGRAVLLVASLAYLAFVGVSLPAFLASGDVEPGAHQLLVMGFVVDVSIGSTFLVLWAAARRHPAMALLLAAALWLAAQLMIVVVSLLAGAYLLIFTGLWLKVVVAILMARGIVAGIRARQIVAGLKRASAKPAPAS